MRSKAPLILVELLCDANMREQLKVYRNHFLRVSSYVFLRSYCTWRFDDALVSFSFFS